METSCPMKRSMSSYMQLHTPTYTRTYLITIIMMMIMEVDQFSFWRWESYFSQWYKFQKEASNRVFIYSFILYARIIHTPFVLKIKSSHFSQESHEIVLVHACHRNTEKERTKWHLSWAWKERDDFGRKRSKSFLGRALTWTMAHLISCLIWFCFYKLLINIFLL